MSDKVVWASNGTATYLASLDPASLRAELVDYGYDEEMLDQYTGEELHLLLNDDYFWEADIEDFDLNIEPMINSQTCDGIVLMVGEVARWTGKHSAGKAVFTEELKGGDIDRDVYEVEIINDGEGLVWLGHHHDGTHRFKLYALPEENQVDFIENCMEDAIEDQFNWYYSDDNLEDVRDKIIDDILAQFTDLDYLNDTINFSQVPNYCKPIVSPSSDTLNDSLNEASTKDSTGLKRELEEIKELAEEYGKEFFTTMPFTSFDNDPTSIEYQYPNFFRIVKSFFKEMGILTPEELNDNDILDVEWDTDISQHDWNVIIRTCEKLANKPGSTVQIEKEYKTGYNSPLNDDEILANREVTEFEEDLVRVPPYEYIFVGDRYNGFLNADDWGMTEEEFKSEVLDYEGKHCHITSIELEVDDDFEDNYYNIKFEDGHELRGVSGTHLVRPVMENLTEDFVDIKYFRLSELNSMIDKVVVFNKKVIYSNLDNYDSEDEKPDFNKLGFEIEKDGDVVIPEGYTAVIKGVSSFEGYNPELYLESNGEGFEIALGWVEFGEISIIDPSLEGSITEALDPGHDYHCEDEDKAKLLVHMYNTNEIKELSELHDKLEPLFATKKDAVEWLYDLTRKTEKLSESLNEEKKTYKCDDCGYEVELDDKEYTGQCPACGEHHGFYEMDENLVEDLKVISDFSEYSPWSGAVDTYNKIEEAGLLNELESALEDMYPEGINQTDLNDLLWFESDYILDMLGIAPEDGEEFEESLVEEDTETWPWGDPSYTGKQEIEA